MMGTHSDSPTLVDTSTGSEFRRWNIGGAKMTIETTQHPYRNLAGASFVTLGEDVLALVNDDAWERVVGLNFVLPGGCELDVDDAELERALEDIEECDENWEDAATRRPDLFTILRDEDPQEQYGILIPLVVNDADLPPLRCLVPLATLQARCQVVEPGTGTHARATTSEEHRETLCRHVGKEFGATNCRGCMRRFWMMKAKELGVIDG